MNNVFQGKNCFISGATGGIGQELAHIFKKYGCNLFLTGRSNEKLDKLKAQLREDVYTQPADLNNLDDLNYVISQARTMLKKIDILINCAGVFLVSSLQESSKEDYDKCFNVNVRAPINITKAFSQEMIENKWGRIINIGSSSAYGGFKDTSLYCASKHALLGFSRSMFNELKEHNVRCMIMSPGSVQTEMGKLVKNQDFNTFIDPKEFAKAVADLAMFDGDMVTTEVSFARMFIQ